LIGGADDELREALSQRQREDSAMCYTNNVKIRVLCEVLENGQVWSSTRYRTPLLHMCIGNNAIVQWAHLQLSAPLDWLSLWILAADVSACAERLPAAAPAACGKLPEANLRLRGLLYAVERAAAGHFWV
jgi:hypothetical protein